MSVMPERVFLRKENGDRGEETLLVSWLPVAGGGCASYVPESRLLAAEARVRELQAPVMCSVCVGRPLPSGKPCICGDTVRTEAAEMHGLRVRCFELEDENEKLEARVRELEVLVRNTEVDTNGAPVTELNTLRADREALAHHLLRYGWHAADCPFLQDTLPCTCGLGAAETHARAILAREVGA